MNRAIVGEVDEELDATFDRDEVKANPIEAVVY
jgi:hypothetical protein